MFPRSVKGDGAGAQLDSDGVGTAVGRFAGCDKLGVGAISGEDEGEGGRNILDGDGDGEASGGINGDGDEDGEFEGA